MLIKRAVIFANGHLPDLDSARALLAEDDFVIAADGGARHALAIGRTPDLVVGDLDSITRETQKKLEQDGVEIIRFSRDKNETDLELAIQHALKLNLRKILIVAALGERLDQTLGNLSLMTDPKLSDLDLRLDDGAEEVFFCRDQARVCGRSGDVVSLIPWQGDVTGVLTSGLKWPLAEETLYANKTRGISNEMIAEIAEVRINSGLLLVVHTRTTVA
ncbi:MAG: thiamine diphosphokinase [Chloroflexi bacterium]|nr:thiamine diphosphokinase [Chloroflexota bacterium]